MSNEKLDKQIHEMRKPLNGISMQAELIKMLAENSPENAKILVAAAKIIENAKACSSMLQDLSVGDDSLPQ